MINYPNLVYFWFSASYVYSAKFIKWKIVRMNTGGLDTNKLGVGALVESDWLFGEPIIKKVPYGCKRGQLIIRPYTDLYRSYNNAWKKERKIKRPTIEEIRRHYE